MAEKAALFEGTEKGKEEVDCKLRRGREKSICQKPGASPAGTESVLILCPAVLLLLEPSFCSGRVQVQGSAGHSPELSGGLLWFPGEAGLADGD